jgi:hypothetical protein
VSGWIKFEKSLETDPRTTRMVRALVTHQRYSPALAVTLVVGALTRLWSYMDTHGREDDTLDLSPHEVDELVGLPGFAASMPESWLVETDDGRVELPNFHAHNSAEAKKQALTAKRVAKHRASKRDAEKRDCVTPCNAGALPDQTRPDLDQTRPEEKERARDRADDPNGFAQVRDAYPRRAGGLTWTLVPHYLALRIDGGSTWSELVEAVRRYAAYCAATDPIGRYVMQPQKFFEGDGWQRPWDVPPDRAAQRLSQNVAVGQEWLASQETAS